MHLFHITAIVLAGAALASAIATPTPTRRSLGLNPGPEDLVNAPGAMPARAPQLLTNAKRFALGLPPLKPRRRGSAARAASSPLPPVTQTCNIFAKGTDGTDYGYISPVWNGFGEYGTFQSAQAGALEVSFSSSPDSRSQLGLTATNGPSAGVPFFGAISGFASSSDDFGAGSPNYAYLGGTTQTAGGATPSSGTNSFTTATGIPENFESAIWSYDFATQALSAQWINTDGSAPATHLLYANDANQALVLTGDVQALRNNFGALYPEVTFTCVPPARSP
ncbi:hypothetical protein FB451DRAFT_490584 [Mycena latifolia]|nr:hypothetical protein FB451DRAFT_490584 [Mycena latifolia]